jgi:hypothetical protein
VRTKTQTLSSELRAAGNDVIRAELVGEDTCSAFNVTVVGYTPILALCRRLIVLGHAPTAPLHVYRGPMLALRVCSIGAGAVLEIGGKGVGFKPLGPVGTAPSIRKNTSAGYPKPRPLQIDHRGPALLDRKSRGRE